MAMKQDGWRVKWKGREWEVKGRIVEGKEKGPTGGGAEGAWVMEGAWLTVARPAAPSA